MKVSVHPKRLASLAFGIFLASVAGVVSLYPSNLMGSDLITEGASFIGLFGLIASLAWFVVFGGGTISPASIVFYSMAVFIFFPALLVILARELSTYEVRALYAAFIVLLAFGIGLKRTPMTVPDSLIQWIWRSHRVMATGGALATLVYVILYLFDPFMKMLWDFAFLGCSLLFVLLGIVVMNHRRLVLGTVYLGVAGGIFLLWYGLVFGGFGRINVAAFILAAFTIYLSLRPSHRAKLVVATLTPVGIIWGGLVGLIRGGGGVSGSLQQIRAILLDRQGIGSLMAPFLEWSRVLGHFDSSGWFDWWDWGGQFLASVLFFIPRAWWPNKQEGFGRLLVYTLSPHLADTGHSMAASVFGEGAAYFGFFGTLFGFVVVALVVYALEKAYSYRGSGTQRIALLLFLTGVWGTGQMLSLVWGGVFTFSVRTLSLLWGLAPLVLALLIAHIGARDLVKAGRVGS